jgi:hypothetical protein
MNGRLWVIAALIGLLLGAGLGYGVSLNQVNVLQGQITTLDDWATSLQKQAITDKAALMSQATALQEQLTTRTDEAANLANQLASIQIQIAALQDQAIAKNGEISTLTAQISDLQRQIPPCFTGAWITIKPFSGLGELTAEFYNIPESEAKLTWAYTEWGHTSLPFYLPFHLYNQGGTNSPSYNGSLDSPTGTTHIHNLTPGIYCLKIGLSYSPEYWTVKIEVWVPAQ